MNQLAAFLGLVAIPAGAYLIGLVGAIGSPRHALHVTLFVAGGELILLGAASIAYAFRKHLA